MDIFSAGNELLVVIFPSLGESKAVPREVLIPFVKAIATVVDLQQRRIEITPPPGLLELN